MVNNLIRGGLVAIGFALTLAMSVSAAYAQEMGFSVWEVVNDNECRARITFLGAREFLFESGEQVATKSYKIKPFGKKGFHKFHMRTTSHNGEVNCAGKLGAGLGDRQDTFILFNDALNEMTFYGAPKPDASFNIIFRKVVAPAEDEPVAEVEVALDTTTASDENATESEPEPEPESQE